MSKEPKFYPIDPDDAYPEGVGTLDQIEHQGGALWIHLNGKRSKLVGLQSLSFLIGQLEQIRAQVFGDSDEVKRYIQHWTMQESYVHPEGEWVKAADHFAVVTELRAQAQGKPAPIDERAAFEKVFTVPDGICFSNERNQYRSMNGRAVEQTDACDFTLRLAGWNARAAFDSQVVESVFDCVACRDLGTVGHGTSCSPMIICPMCDGKSALAPGDDAPPVPAAGEIPPMDVSELAQALHDAAKWESLYRNEHAACTRLLDTMEGYRKQREELQKRLTGPVSIAMPDLKTEFPLWWEETGQYIRAGGGQYERSFGYGAYRDALARVAEMNATAAPEEAQP